MTQRITSEVVSRLLGEMQNVSTLQATSPDFGQPTTVNHQGTVLAFSRDLAGQGKEIYFNVLDLAIDSENDDQDWKGFQKVTFPDHLSSIGSSLIAVRNIDGAVLGDAQTAFKVVSDGNYVNVLRQSSKGSLLINRFVLKKEPSPAGPEASEFVLTPAWQVRFERSGKADVPANDRDTQNYRSPDGEPFIEPTWELSMVTKLQDGKFDVLLIPDQESQSHNWQIIAYNAETKKIDLFSFTVDFSGLPDLTGKTIDANNQIEPDSSFSLQLKAQAGNTPAPFVFGPSATLYSKQERVRGAETDDTLLKRSGRMILSVPVQVESANKTAVVDFGISNKGKLAEIPSNPAIPYIQPANYTLQFDLHAFVTLENNNDSLSIRSSYEIECYILIEGQLKEDQLLIGGDPNAAAESAAPYIKLTSELAIGTGFGDGTQAVAASTDVGLLRLGEWQKITVKYDTEPASDNFTILLNGEQVHVNGGAKATPSGTPISQISALQTGFVGLIDNLIVTVGGAVAGHWRFDGVNYNEDPPQTEDSSANKNTGRLFGPMLVPSSAPIYTASSGELIVDSNGATSYLGVLDFVQPKSTPSFLEGSDGLIHLYFQGADDGFDVAHYEVENSRAIFSGTWTATSKDNSADSQSGIIDFVASRTGTFMNNSAITITSAANAELCNVTIDDKQGMVEKWEGVPRKLDAFTTVLKGQSVNDPSNQSLKNGKAVFFDTYGKYDAINLPAASATDDYTISFLSRRQKTLPLYSLAVSDATETDCTVTIRFNPLRWNADSGAPTKLITQTWLKAPVFAQALIDTLNGVSTTYDYSRADSTNAAAYGIAASYSTSDEQNSRVIIFTQESVSEFKIKVSGDSATVCTVDIELVADGVSKQALWTNVLRSQNEFAKTLEGGSLTYDLERSATGDPAEVSELILIITDNLDVNVLNHDPCNLTDPKANMLAGVSLFEVFPDGMLAEAVKVSNQDTILAAILQSAYVDNTEPRVYLPSGSTLFGALAVTVPSNGAIATVDNTAPLTSGTANLVQNGVNGGWIQESPRKAIRLSGSNETQYDVACSTINTLSIAGDMSLELWCQPNVQTASPSEVPRLLTFNKHGNLDFPDEDFQYLAGLKDTPCLKFSNETRVQGASNLPKDNGSCSFQIWVNVPSHEAGTILFYGTAGIVKPYLVLSLNDSGEPTLTYGDSSATITGKAEIALNKWVQLTATLEDTGTDQVTLALYVGGVLDKSERVAKAPISQLIGTFYAGSLTNALPMRANGVCLWHRTISAKEVGRDHGRAVPNNDVELVIKWYLNEGQGNTVENKASAGVELTSTIQNAPPDEWNEKGVFFRPFVGHATLGLEATDQVLLGGWRHLAMTYRSAFSIDFPGTAFADAGNKTSLDLDQAFTLEFWFQPARLNQLQALISKPGAYEVVLNADNTIHFRIWTSLGIQDLKSSAAAKVGEAYYVTSLYSVGQKEPQEGDKVSPEYFVKASLYVNDVLNDSLDLTKTDSVTTDISETNLNLGRNSGNYAYFAGLLSDVRIWNRLLTTTEINNVWQYHAPPSNQDGLVSYWRFSEMRGKVAFDSTGLNNAILTSNELWSLFRPASAMSLYVDGNQAEVARITLGDYGGYGDRQFTVGALQSSGLKKGFSGAIDDVRIWNSALTAEQLTDNMYRPLTGKEPRLAGYWRFDTGSGTKIDDRTGRLNNGTLSPASSPPEWITSRAPLSNEAQIVYNVLGGVETFFQESITGPPSVVEYADTQRDSLGQIFSVMKRCYVAPVNGFVTLFAGYKVGDLDTVYVGQVQTKPTLIGYIEGAPPIPSENQTMPFWAGDISELLIYAEATSININQATEASKTFSNTMNSGDNIQFEGGFGLFFATSSSLSFGLGAETEWQTWALEGRLGFKSEKETATKSENQLSFSYGKPRSITDTLTPGGQWENKDHILNPVVGRRFVPDNLGYALVKSLTADLYVVTLQGTNTPVKYTIVPNTDIPEDVNIIDFPINPRYVKNGTLDGKVGLENDPDYRGADLTRGSYFKPIEAYALKRQIERQDQQLDAYYAQYNEADYSGRSTGFERFKERAFEKDPSYDWDKRLSKRSIVNTYVWTAGGGLHAEQENLMDSYTESFGAISEFSKGLGLHVDSSVAFVAGIFAELDLLFGQTVEVTSTKSQESSDSFSLESTAKPDWYLKRPIMSAQGELEGYTRDDAPGKVDAYRYMSFFLPPKQSNYDFFFDQVVDQNWLQNSMQPNAAALREASMDPNGSWRVLHRVTYVSRIPPQFQPTPDETQAPDVVWPPNVEDNTVLTRLVEKQVSQNGQPPSPVEIGTAVAAVLGSSATDPGVLGQVLPWWKTFLAEAQDIRSNAYKTLAELRVDLLGYMVQKYEAEAYGKLKGETEA